MKVFDNYNLLFCLNSDRKQNILNRNYSEINFIF